VGDSSISLELFYIGLIVSGPLPMGEFALNFYFGDAQDSLTEACDINGKK